MENLKEQTLTRKPRFEISQPNRKLRETRVDKQAISYQEIPRFTRFLGACYQRRKSETRELLCPLPLTISVYVDFLSLQALIAFSPADASQHVDKLHMNTTQSQHQKFTLRIHLRTLDVAKSTCSYVMQLVKYWAQASNFSRSLGLQNKVYVKCNANESTNFSVISTDSFGSVFLLKSKNFRIKGHPKARWSYKPRVKLKHVQRCIIEKYSQSCHAMINKLNGCITHAMPMHIHRSKLYHANYYSR